MKPGKAGRSAVRSRGAVRPRGPAPVVLVTGFEPFGTHPVNPSGDLAKAVDGRRAGGLTVVSAVLPVSHGETAARAIALLEEHRPRAVLHLGLAEGRARLALERVAINVMDYRIPDNGGFQAAGEPCRRAGPPAYFSTLPLGAILAALTAEGIPAYVSNTAGTFLCNETLYGTLHQVHTRGLATRAGFLHLPLLPAMVAAAGLELPSMDLGLMVRGVEVALRVIAETA
jgi:pyroglutamyl-peptidase